MDECMSRRQELVRGFVALFVFIQHKISIVHALSFVHLHLAFLLHAVSVRLLAVCVLVCSFLRVNVCVSVLRLNDQSLVG